MSIKSTIATATAGAARWGLRSVLHRSGGALPGKLGLAIDPELVTHLACLLDASVVITGTNGKTTTTNLIADAVAASGASCVCNRAGNNMETGITGALLEANSDRRRTAGKRRVGVFECDELYTVRILPRLKPTYFVLLNLFRDQLDRYGEIDHTQDVIAQALALSPTTTLIFNADDPLCASIAARVPNPSCPLASMGRWAPRPRTSPNRGFADSATARSSTTTSSTGSWAPTTAPPAAGSAPRLASFASDVRLSRTGYTFDVSMSREGAHDAARLSTKYNGLYMVYNITAAWTAASALGTLDDAPSRFQNVLDTYVPTGGRMTRWHVGGREVATDLAKNPVGFDRQIQQIKTAQGRLMAFFLNDAEADGRDVSWIWDVDFERLSATPGIRAFVGGTRAHDLQVRLKYAGHRRAHRRAGGRGARLGCRGARRRDPPCGCELHRVPPVVKELERMAKDGAAANGDTTAVNDASTAVDGTAEHVPTSMVNSADEAAPSSAADAAGTPEAGASAPAALDRPLRIVHLYPDALNLYGDGGNAIVLARRCAWRGIPVRVDDVRMGDELDLSTADVVLIGGGADCDQLAVVNELRSQRDKLASYIEQDGVMLAICGSYQLLGRSYYMDDTRVEGLGVIGAETVRGEGRLTGNVAVASDLFPHKLVGFENHGGRTKLDADETPLGAAVVAGTGNNGDDGFEGLRAPQPDRHVPARTRALQEPRPCGLAACTRPRAARPRRRCESGGPCATRGTRRRLRTRRERGRHKAPSGSAIKHMVPNGCAAEPNQLGGASV